MKPIDIDELYDRRFITSELESSFNNDDAIDASGITQVQPETAVFQKQYKKEDIPVCEVGEEVEATAVPGKQIQKSSINIEIFSANDGKMGESVKAAAVPDKNNEESIEAEALSGKKILLIIWMQKQVLIMK